MTVISNSVEIRCTPEEAFDYLSDHRNELEWNPGIESIDKLTDGPVGLGTKYLAKWKSAPKAVKVETIAYDRPHGWTVHNGGPVEVTVTIRLQPTAEGTLLSSDFDARPHGWFRLIFPLFLMKIRKEEAANMTHLKAALERRGRGPGQLAMRRLTTRPDHAPVTGPAAWFIRFVGVDGVIGPLGFGGFTIPAIISVAQGRGIIYVWGNPTYGDGPFERIGVPTTVPLLVGFLAACLVQLVGAGLLIWLRPSGFIVMPTGMLLSAIFWWGFDLPLAWLGAGPDLAFLAAAWLVYTRASRKPVQRANRVPHCNQHETPASRKGTWSALI